MHDESHLPFAQQSLVFRLRKRAEIRRANDERKSVRENRPDRVADLLEEAARELERYAAQSLDAGLALARVIDVAKAHDHPDRAWVGMSEIQKTAWAALENHTVDIPRGGPQ